MTDPLAGYNTRWQDKPVLKIIYDDFYRRIAQACNQGLTLELGGGIGNLKQRLPHVISTDIQFASWLDCVADAQRLPFGNETLNNIVMVDVLHHVEFPWVFFREAERVLLPGGRIVMIEPAITWGSSLFYRLLHHEPVIVSADPLSTGIPDPARDPYDSNQAIPTLIATRERERFHRIFPNLTITLVDWFSFLVYPLSGGFKPWSLIPARIAQPLLSLESRLEAAIGRGFAFRMMIVVEKARVT